MPRNKPQTRQSNSGLQHDSDDQRPGSGGGQVAGEVEDSRAERVLAPDSPRATGILVHGPESAAYTEAARAATRVDSANLQAGGVLLNTVCEPVPFQDDVISPVAHDLWRRGADKEKLWLLLAHLWASGHPHDAGLHQRWIPRRRVVGLPSFDGDALHLPRGLPSSPDGNALDDRPPHLDRWPSGLRANLYHGARSTFQGRLRTRSGSDHSPHLSSRFERKLA
mmetsp:Transcript_32228/g.87347  ORF Transcript_32228/g.87347 Transcript_32228/m.87347 type:complete len:223 (+) Transcript_32228:36-704(+)